MPPTPLDRGRTRRLLLLLPLLLAVASQFPAPARAAGDREHIREHYTKHELDLPMRDGVKLHTAVYVPKDASKRYPILLVRTPYGVGPYGVDAYPDGLVTKPLLKARYIVALQDVRGRYMSGGKFVDVRPIVAPAARRPRDVDESTDAYDTIDGLLKRVAGHNGRVGMMGISYPGFYAAAALVAPHPALKAVSPQAPIADWFIGDDFHQNGAFFLASAFNFLADFGRPRPAPTKKRVRSFEHDTPDGYDFFLRMGPLANADTKFFKSKIAFWKELMQHGTYDAFWQARDLSRHLARATPGRARPAVLTVGGWYDAEDLYGALQTHRALERAGGGAQNRLVLGPWSHGGWERSDGEALGPVSFGARTAVFFREKIELPFFEEHLRQKGPSRLPKAYVFETGTNQWRAEAAWPPRGATRRALCFRAGGELSFARPTEDEAHDQYVSDPARPVPYSSQISVWYPHDYMVEDQRFAARRPDVLVYQTAPLTEDLTIGGPLEARLHVSTSGTDADFIVKLIDVYPDDYPEGKATPRGVRLGAYQQLVRGAPLRGKFRKSFERPEPFVPGRVEPLRFALTDVLHTFRRGHRIMVQVQSSWFPLVDRNPQTFVDIYAARPGDFRVATQRVYRSRRQPSCLEVLVVPPPRR